jgi:hypothetical protein
VTVTSRTLALTTLTALALTLAACATTASPTGDPTPPAASSPAPAVRDGACDGEEGVTLLVDASALRGGDRTEWCVPADGEIAAADVLSEAGVTTEGTEEYGDDVICRVNGLPSADAPVGSTEDPAYVETCASIGPAFAYWSLWTAPAGASWDYATEGVATLEVAPGDSLGLLFTLDGAPATPTS